MVDLFNRQRTPSESSGILKVAGVNGSNLAPNFTRTIQPVQTSEVPNVSQQFLQRGTQSINQSIQRQQDLIATRSRNASAVAAAESQSTSGQGIAGVVGGLAAGLELFTQLRAQRQQQQIEVDTAVFENRIRDQIIQMNRSIATSAHDEGFIPTQQRVFREIERQFAHLPTATRQEVFGIAQRALNEAQREQSTRLISATRDNANAIREQRKFELETITTHRIESLAFANSSEQINETLDLIFDDVESYLSRTNISGTDAIVLTSHIYEQFNQTLEQNGRHTAETRAKLNAFNAAASRAIQIHNETQGNPRLRELELARLNAEFDNILPSVDFRTLIPTSAQVANQYVEEQQSFNALRQLQNRNSFLNTEVTEADYFKRGQIIFNVHDNNPLGADLRSAVSSGAITFESHPEIVSAVRQAEEFESDINDYRDLSQQYLDYQIEIEQNRALIAEAADQLDPTGRLGQLTQPDQMLREVIELAGRERGRISAETAEALRQLYGRRIGTFRNRSVDTRQQLDNLIQKWNRYGLQLDNPRDRTLLDQLGARAQPLIEQAEREFRDRRSRIPAGQGGTPNFSVGTMTTVPPIVPLHTDREGLTLPFQSAQPGEIVATSEYGPRINPVTGRAGFHAGIDIDTTNGDENVRSIAGGTVLHVGEWSGFGGTITVQTDSGHVEQYSHLRRFAVQPGDVLAPGTIIGLMGGGENDPMAGRSTGRHLHLQIYSPDTDIERIGRPPYEGTTVNPRDYLISVQHSSELPLGTGLPPTQSHPGSDQLSLGNTWLNETFNNYRLSNHIGGSAVYSGNLSVAVTPTSLYNNSNPQPNRRASVAKAAYPTQADPTHNYGYEVLRDDPDLSAALARTANNLSIPGQWLADVIDYESGFKPHIANSLGAVGLIQFYPGGGLKQVANQLGVSEQAAADHLRGLTAAEQMPFVETYLRPYASRIRTVEDLLAVIWGGPNLLNKTPQQRQRVTDGFITFSEYLSRLGRRTGRRYQTSYDRTRAAANEIHYSFTPSCARCNQMLSQLGQVVPHNVG